VGSGLFDTVLVRSPNAEIIRCVSSHPLRSTVNYEKALEQHREYVKTLEDEGIEVVELDPLEGFPDSVFIQDTAVVGLKTRKALISRFGVESRRGEELSVAEVLAKKGFKIFFTEEPHTIEGGDVLVTDVGVVYVGVTSRTNLGGVSKLAEVFNNVTVLSIPTDKVFHLLSAVNYIGDKTLALVPELVSPRMFEHFKILRVPLDEAYAANMLYLGDKRVLIPKGYRKTEEILRNVGYEVIAVDVSEFQKCDGGVTCLSLPLYKTL